MRIERLQDAEQSFDPIPFTAEAARRFITMAGLTSAAGRSPKPRKVDLMIAALLGLYAVPAQRREELLDPVREAAKPGMVLLHGSDLPEQWKVLIGWETMATALQHYEPAMIPGLLQTSDYARAIIQGTDVNQLSETDPTLVHLENRAMSVMLEEEPT